MVRAAYRGLANTVLFEVRCGGKSMNSAQNNGSGEAGGNAPEAGLSERRDRLNQKLDERRTAEQRQEQERSKGDTRGYAQAMKLSSEFIAGIVVGGGIGWLVDQWLETTPFGLIVFLLLGFAAGVLNVLRSAGYVAEPERRIGEMSKDTHRNDRPK